MKLVDDAKDFWKWYSTWAMSLAAAIPFAWQEAPQDIKDKIPEEWMPWIVAAVLVAGLVGRVKKQ